MVKLGTVYLGGVIGNKTRKADLERVSNGIAIV